MERDNKYYSIIETLIKQHRKYNGLDAILEDIIDDVYVHSEVVINSVQNEEVVMSYLTKVVSTSIITVPKRLNFHPEIAHRAISSISPTVTVEPVVQQVLTPIQPKQEEVKKIEVETEKVEAVVNPDLVDKMINGVEKIEPLAPVDTVDEDILEELVTLDDSTESTSVEGENLELETSQNNSDLEELLDIQDDFENTEIVELEEASNNLEENLLENDTDTVEELSVVEELNDFEPLENIAEFEEIAPEDSVLEEVEELEEVAESDTLTLQSDDEALELQENAQDDLLLEDGSDDIVNLGTTELESNLVELDEETLLEPENASEERVFHPINYSVFNYTPQKEDNNIDIDEIKEHLIELAQRRADLKITEVYNLKYKDSLAPTQIAQKLEISEETVFEALNEIIALI